MKRSFNVTGACNPEKHYMVNLRERLEKIREMVDKGDYFTINCARQYGKTTAIKALAEFLREDYVVLSLDFQKLGNAEFENEYTFSAGFAAYLLRTVRNRRSHVYGLDGEILSKLEETQSGARPLTLAGLFAILSDLCDTAEKPVVLMIDEIDSATNNQIFLDFLAQLRGYYLTREETPTFRSVILAGVYDVKNIRQKLRMEEEHKVNSPWNIAADFDIEMSFSKEDIAGMLAEYEEDVKTGMEIEKIAGLLYDYTSGYPFLVSKLCMLMDEKIAPCTEFRDKNDVWTREGVLEAVKILLSQKNTLFESLMGKLMEYPQLKQKIYAILFGGEKVVFSAFDVSTDIALMLGFVRKENGLLIIANRIFETVLYDYFLTAEDSQEQNIFRIASRNKNQFLQNGFLDMELVLKKYVEYFSDIYGAAPKEFDEEEGRRRKKQE